MVVFAVCILATHITKTLLELIDCTVEITHEDVYRGVVISSKEIGNDR